MIEVMLSDHTEDQSNIAAAKRRAEYEAARQHFLAAVDARKKKGETLRQASHIKFSSGKYGAWLLSLLSRMWHAMSAPPRVPQMAEASQEEIVWNAGGEGEKRVSGVLAQFLSDEWTVVSGYRNRGGEIDKILIGPTGLLAIEIKYVNGIVSCNGDEWRRDKYDNYGNLVETDVPIADKRGRGPSAQVNGAADRLQAFLEKRTTISRIARAVVLSHASSEVGQIQNQTVDLVATLDQLDARTISATVTGGLGGSTVKQVLALVQKDHQFNERPRKPEARVNAVGGK